MQRRTFIKKSTLTAISVGLLGVIQWNGKSTMTSKTLKVNGQRIASRIAELAKFGRDEKGHGYRVAFTQGDIEGRAWFIDLMRKAGLDTSIDAAGNIIGKRKGKNSSFKPIAFGSHIDMVPDGGNYDGTLGSIAALEIIEILNENKIITEHPLEVIVFANEEGGTIGSSAMVGRFTRDDLQRKSQSGLIMAEGIKAIGGNPDNIESCIRKKGDIHSWLELHIEQGGILENENIQIGIVEGIVSMQDWNVTVEGFANHAGATPMNLRKDALLSASKLAIAVNETINSIQGRQVGTIGKIKAYPGASNVIPGKVELSLEIRDLSVEKVNSLFAEIQKKADAIAKADNTKISFEKEFNLPPALTNERLRLKIKESVQQLNLSSKLMQSGPYHDSAQMNLITPIAMIFVPSIGGISHSHDEFTKAEDMTNGANVLLSTVLMVDKE